MKTTYKGFKIEAHREKCMAGYKLLYYSVYTSDGVEVTVGYEDSDEKVRDKVEQLKEVVDDYIEHPEDWDIDLMRGCIISD
jgi:hypothetical protein